jgi:ribosomal protein S18 acetylase RimI-like enzyme
MRTEFLPWESELLGKKGGRLVDAGGYGEFAPEDYAFLVARLRAGEEEVLGRLIRDGFELVETTLHFMREGARIDFSFDERIVVVEATDSQVEEAAAVAGETFEHSRFLRDRLIPELVGRESRCEWVRNARSQARGEILASLVAGVVSGFLVSRPDAGCSVLDLMGVRPEAKGAGIGTALVAAYLRRSRADAYQVSTQSTNRASIELYRKTGYRYRDTSYVLHWHAPG